MGVSEPMSDVQGDETFAEHEDEEASEPSIPDRRQEDRRSGDRRRAERRTGLDRRRGPGRRRGEVRREAEEGEMSGELLEFIMAIDEYKRINDRPFPAWSEIFEIIHYLGYRRVADRAEHINQIGRAHV